MGPAAAREHSRYTAARKPHPPHEANVRIVANHRDPTPSGPQPSATRSTNTCVDCVIGFLSTRISTLRQHCTGAVNCLPGNVYWNILQPHYLEHPSGGNQ